MRFFPSHSICSNSFDWFNFYCNNKTVKTAITFTRTKKSMRFETKSEVPYRYKILRLIQCNTFGIFIQFSAPKMYALKLLLLSFWLFQFVFTSSLWLKVHDHWCIKVNVTNHRHLEKKDRRNSNKNQPDYSIWYDSIYKSSATAKKLHL